MDDGGFVLGLLEEVLAHSGGVQGHLPDLLDHALDRLDYEGVRVFGEEVQEGCEDQTHEDDSAD